MCLFNATPNFPTLFCLLYLSPYTLNLRSTPLLGKAYYYFFKAIVFFNMQNYGTPLAYFCFMIVLILLNNPCWLSILCNITILRSAFYCEALMLYLLLDQFFWVQHILKISQQCIYHAKCWSQMARARSFSQAFKRQIYFLCSAKFEMFYFI